MCFAVENSHNQCFYSTLTHFHVGMAATLWLGMNNASRVSLTVCTSRDADTHRGPDTTQGHLFAFQTSHADDRGNIQQSYTIMRGDRLLETRLSRPRASAYNVQWQTYRLRDVSFCTYPNKPGCVFQTLVPLESYFACTWTVLCRRKQLLSLGVRTPVSTGLTPKQQYGPLSCGRDRLICPGKLVIRAKVYVCVCGNPSYVS